MIIDKKNDAVNPSHYKDECSIECWDVMDLISDMIEYKWPGYTTSDSHYLLTVFKYLWRYKAKNGEEDVRKADNYFKNKVSGGAKISPFGKWLESQIYKAKEFYGILEVEDCFTAGDTEDC